jgi:hypothetical protein
VGVAVIAEVVPLVAIDSFRGATDTDLSEDTGAVIVMIAGPAPLVTPLRVAFTNRDTVPAVLPAVNVVVLAVGEPNVPMVGLLMLHAYVVPAQLGVHTGVAVNGAVATPVATWAVRGLRDTEEMLDVPLYTLMLTVWYAEIEPV